MNNDLEIIEKKRKTWADMGVSTYNAELKLQAMASDACNKFSIPSNYNDLIEAESDLKTLKQSQKLVETERKAITSKFDELCSRLMNPEKSFNEPIKLLTEAIIKVKKEHEVKQKVVEQQNNERKAIKDMVLNYINNKDAEIKSFISNKVSNALQYALKEGDVTMETLPDFLISCEKKYETSFFNIEPPKYHVTAITADECQQIIAENFKWDPIFYFTLYKAELLKKFSDYEVQVNNKIQALELAAKQEAEKQHALAVEKANKETAIKLESLSVDISTISNTGVKELKKVYEIDMPETIESVLAIMSAFSANIHLCMPKLKVNKWFAFTPLQAGNALAKVKCDDNVFNPSGIIFKEVSKL